MRTAQNLSQWLALAAALVLSTSGARAASATWLHSYHFPHGSTGPLAVRDGYAYILNRWSRGDGILVFDTREPTRPRFVRGLAGRGYLMGCAFSGQYMYIPAWFSLMVVDISDPTQCHLVRNMSFGFPAGDAGSVAVSGNRLFLGGRGGGLRILDLSEPRSPVIAAHHPAYGKVGQLFASGNLLVMRPRRGDAIVATVEGFSLKEQSRLRLGSRIRIVGSALYAADTRGTVIHDLRDPAKPAIKTRLPGLSPVGMLTRGQMLAASKEGKLTVLDVSTPLSPVTRREIELPEGVKLGTPALHNALLYTVDRDRVSLRIFDLSADKARELGERPIVRNEGNVEIGDGYAFLSYANGLNTTILTVDLKKPGSIDCVGRVDQAPVTKTNTFTVNDVFQASAFRRVGQYLLTGNGLVDVADPLAPKVTHQLTRTAAAITVHGGLAYLAQGDRMTIADVSRLPALSVVGEYRPEGAGAHITDVALGDGVAYLVSGSRKKPEVAVLDVSRPARPELLGRCDVPPSIVCALKGRYLYVPAARPPGEEAGLAVIDVSNPKAPTVAKTVGGLVNTSCYRIRVHGNHLYLTDSMRGIKVADLRDPLNPKRVGTYTGPADVCCSYTDFEIVDDKLYGQRHSQLDVWRLAE